VRFGEPLQIGNLIAGGEKKRGAGPPGGKGNAGDESLSGPNLLHSKPFKETRKAQVCQGSQEKLCSWGKKEGERFNADREKMDVIRGEFK